MKPSKIAELMKQIIDYPANSHHLIKKYREVSTNVVYGCVRFECISRKATIGFLKRLGIIYYDLRTTKPDPDDVLDTFTAYLDVETERKGRVPLRTRWELRYPCMLVFKGDGEIEEMVEDSEFEYRFEEIGA